MENKFYVYLHRKATTGEVFYVGKGYGDRAYSKNRGKHWHNVVNKHGLIVEFAETGLDEETAFELEEHLINFFGRADQGRGKLINKTDGGEGVSGLVHSEETRAKISEATSGEKNPRFGKGHLIAGEQNPMFGRTGEKNPMFGKKHSEEVRMKISGEKSPHVKPVLCVTTGEVFPYIKAAAVWCNGHGPDISSACRGILKSAGKHPVTKEPLTWSYA